MAIFGALPCSPPHCHTLPQIERYTILSCLPFLGSKATTGRGAADAKHKGGEALLRAWISAPEQPISFEQKYSIAKKLHFRLAII